MPLTRAELVAAEVAAIARAGAPDLEPEFVALRATFDPSYRRELAYEHRGYGKGRSMPGSRTTYACVRCHNLIRSRIARCSKCGWSHSHADPGVALN